MQKVIVSFTMWLYRLLILILIICGGIGSFEMNFNIVCTHVRFLTKFCCDLRMNETLYLYPAKKGNNILPKVVYNEPNTYTNVSASLLLPLPNVSAVQTMKLANSHLF